MNLMESQQFCFDASSIDENLKRWFQTIKIPKHKSLLYGGLGNFLRKNHSIFEDNTLVYTIATINYLTLARDSQEASNEKQHQ